MRLRRKKREPYKELQSEDAGLTANDVMTDKQVQAFTNTLDYVEDDDWPDWEQDA